MSIAGLRLALTVAAGLAALARGGDGGGGRGGAFELLRREAQKRRLQRQEQRAQRWLLRGDGDWGPRLEEYYCDLYGDATRCPLAELPANASNVLQTGGETRCIFDDSTPYAFQVVPGSASRLLVYFQGGGACFNEDSTELGLCSTDAAPYSPLDGILDPTDAKNPYVGYTVVIILYCSGDAHGGNVVRDYEVDGSSVVQVGQLNVQAALDWVAQQQDNGGLNAELDDLVMSGESAGSLGVQIWGADVAEQISAKRVKVLPDAFVGVFPETYTPQLIYDYGICPWFSNPNPNPNPNPDPDPDPDPDRNPKVLDEGGAREVLRPGAAHARHNKRPARA
eukprot:CAMPEP_0118857550 /NCGR_PEP_ID=MMETSP1163-20130328/4596_1 /TAXON_ID=124430 /ORGANISM="Phaeomonas parva, Strain CCMP2877" /LENGTH=336 /DNA_ID=CAMNT_0006790875 /DNA_START=236 /DNA_END=1242 /DNA_ORIENTATION=-